MEGKNMKSTCFDCVHSIKYPGIPARRNVPEEPPGAECQHPEVLKKKFTDEDDYDTLPKKCGHFNPEIVKLCENCKRDINQPKYIWQIWAATPYEYLACCSKKCAEELQEKINESIGIKPIKWR